MLINDNQVEENNKESKIKNNKENKKNLPISFHLFSFHHLVHAKNAKDNKNLWVWLHYAIIVIEISFKCKVFVKSANIDQWFISKQDVARNVITKNIKKWLKKNV